MKISYITTYNALDVHNWSGLGYNIAKTLADHHAELEYIGDLQMRHEKVFKAKRSLYAALGKRYLIERNLAVAKGYARQIEGRISPASDFVFCPGSLPIACLDTPKPKIFYTDATFAGMVGFYNNFSNLTAETIKKGNQLEQTALSSCALALYASDWAAETAIAHYEVDPKKVKVVPFGANIECNRSLDDIKNIVRQRSRTTCNLLFLGVDWERKGGELAVQIMQALNKAGLPTQLHIAGIRSLPFSELPEHVTDHGFISKSTPAGVAQLEKLMAESHFLVLPTKAEAYGLVFCEANSFGVPAIATNIGGVPTIVKEDVNGRLFPLSAPATDYAAYILSRYENYQLYEDLALSSFNEFQTRLNWTVAGKKIMELLKEL
ncbi:MAG TPA: glycosyltransferase family 4 protein [Puia sp.]|jgi:glycosyltransferase involved in cell wall biosynthesis|nr:glycosyltransferase family 4 protein [Puia sp.]